MKVCVIRSYKRLQIGTDIRCSVLHKPVVLVLQRCSGILLCQDLKSLLSRLPTSMVSPVCDSGTGSSLCYGIGTGMWQWYESTPVADIAVNRHQSGISSLES